MRFRGYTPKNDYQPKVCLAVFCLTLQSLTLMEILGIFSSCPKLNGLTKPIGTLFKAQTPKNDRKPPRQRADCLGYQAAP